MSDRSNEVALPDARRGRHTTWLVVAVLVVAVGVVAGLVTAGLSSNSSPAASSSGSTPISSAPTGGTRPTGFAPPQLTGIVATVASSSFTVTTRAGTTTTVEVTKSTTYSGNGLTGLSSLKEGTVVAVYGTDASSSEIDATRISGFGGFGGGRRGGFPGGRAGAFGSITAIGSNSFTISSRTGTSETVDVSAATTYASSGGALSGLSALRTGEEVAVQGGTSGSVIRATEVRVIQPGTGGGFGGGFGG